MQIQFAFARLGFVAALVISSAWAQTLIKDINANGQQPSSSPSNLIVSGSTVYFAAGTPSLGIELWKTDGTAAGTQLVKDIRSGSLSSSPSNLVMVGSTLFFTADDGLVGTELWKSDGTAAGTQLVKDIFVGGPLDGAFPASLTALGGTLLFSAYDGSGSGAGRELWKSDGTSGGTTIVKDIRPGSASSTPGAFCAFGSTLLFGADDGSNGIELWKSDGTSGGTVLVKDIASGSGSSMPQGLTVLGSSVIFSADDGTNGVELWQTTGTAAGTTILRNINLTGSSFPNQFTVLGTRAYFAANDGLIGVELWRTDGTLVGTTLVSDIAAGSTSSAPLSPVVVGTKLYFTAFTSASGRELWSSDGTGAGTTQIADLTPGIGSSVITQMIAVGSTLAFTFVDAASGQEVWRSDGTALGTQRVRDINAVPGAGSGPAWLTRFGTVLLFSANDGVLGQELWRSDLTFAGTFMVKDIAGLQSAASNPQSFVVVGSKAFFIANDGVHNYEIWVTDGTTAGTKMVKDINPDIGLTTIPRELLSFGGKLWFTADDGMNGRELWTSDGTAAGTNMVRDIWVGPSGSAPMALTVYSGAVWFSAEDGNPVTGKGRELWKSDGTSAGTVLVKDLAPGAQSGMPASSTALNVLGSTLIVFGSDGNSGLEVWACDGTAAGTTLVKDVNPGPDSGVVTVAGGVAIASGALFFNGFDPANGQELWKTDGTASGTVLVRDTYPGTTSSLPYPMIAFSGGVYFQANDALHGYELWCSDGTASGTTLVADASPGSQDGMPCGFVVANDRLFFHAFDSSSGSPKGRELWVSDGTSSGTTIVRDIAPGATSAISNGLVRPLALGAGRKVAFAANDGTKGIELWTSNGTALGTKAFGDLNPGSADGVLPNLEGVILGNQFLFAADNGNTGNELYAVALRDLGVAVVEPIGQGCPGTGAIVPKISAVAVPTVGNSTFGIRITEGRPSSPAVLLLNNARQDVAIGGGCTIFVALPAVSVSTSTNATGLAVVSLPLPPDPVNIGVELFFQGAVIDPGGAWLSLASITAGLRIVVGQD